MPNCVLIQRHIAAGHLFLPADGPALYFDSDPGRATWGPIETIDGVRDDFLPLSCMFTGHRQAEWARRYVREPGFGDQPYPCLAHGLGTGDEWPVIHYPVNEDLAYDGAIEPGMVVCVESYVGEVGGSEGVKHENRCLVTESGPVVLSRYPFEDELLAGTTRPARASS